MHEAALQAAISRQSFHRFTPHTLDSPILLKQELAAIRFRHAEDFAQRVERQARGKFLDQIAGALGRHAVDEALLQYLSPLGWEHINLTGDYVWRSSTKVGAGKFRPLRPLSTA